MSRQIVPADLRLARRAAIGDVDAVAGVVELHATASADCERIR